MAKAFTNGFYKTQSWKRCREAYAKSVGYLCENCLAKGLYKPGEIVHHMIEIRPENINNPEITLSFDNLRLLCRDCHAEQHAKRNEGRRYIIGPDGEVTINAKA